MDFRAHKSGQTNADLQESWIWTTEHDIDSMKENIIAFVSRFCGLNVKEIIWSGWQQTLGTTKQQANNDLVLTV